MGLDLLESALPHVTCHRCFHRRRHAIPHHTQGVHRLSTELSTKESGRNGHRWHPLRPENGISVLRILTAHCSGWRGRAARAGRPLARTGSANETGRALGLRDRRNVRSGYEGVQREFYFFGPRADRRPFGLTGSAAIRYTPTLVIDSLLFPTRGHFK